MIEMRMKMGMAIVAAAMILASVVVADAATQQRAFALKDPVTLHAKPDEGSKSWEASLPEGGVAAPSAVRDKSDDLWYKVTVDGRTGWLHQEGVRLKMGPKSKSAVGVYERCAGVRAKAMAGKIEGWSEGEPIAVDDGEVVTWTTDGGLFQVLVKGSKTEDVYFRATGPAACKALLGADLIGMRMDALRSKMGTPTMRETPDGERDVDILSYELQGRDMTLAFHMSEDELQWVELHRGGTGEATKGWSPDVLYERER